MVWQNVALSNDKMAFNLQKIKIIALFISAAALQGCQPPAPTPVAVTLLWQGQPLRCGQSLPLREPGWQLSQLQFYLADFSLDGQPLALVDSAWQNPTLALLGTDCHSEAHWQLWFAKPLPDGELQFSVGVPAALNHQNPLTARHPLQQADMHWSWQSGYKFFRLDLQGPAGGWSMHLGSTGCQSASVMRAPTEPCKAPNRPQVRIPWQSGSRLTLDLAALFAKLQPDANNSCMSDPNQRSCQQLLPVFGLSGPQQLWGSMR